MGGLGVIDLEVFNRALLSKWVWKFILEERALWKQVVVGGLQRRRQQYLQLPQPSLCYSMVWKNISRLGRPILSAVRWSLGRGDQIRFWSYHWCGTSPLQVIYHEFFEVACNQVGTVRELWDQSALGVGWVFQLRRRLEEEFLQYTQLYCVLANFRIDELKDDEPLWVDSAGFSVHAAYSWWGRDHPFNLSVARKSPQIWGCKAPLKVRFFIWLAFNKRLLTRAYRANWRLADSLSCALCADGVETTSHLFCECRLMLQVGAD
ncbi:hypothetical protein QJS10_CPB20g00796 [Acorus calamus]|uniref:Reverse transcriptase zinc-binding domain-containing protein n=1 Tax=Acorus calamus TaxID=4465 RepID=A0AAV9CB96_ACOCL|nr:hypothetical protein QJS10_CPB20g00796 [Acorus calamus]